jgi:peptide chain release factor
MILLISSGQGPEECGWVVNKLTHSLLDEANQMSLTTNVVEVVEGHPGTYFSAMIDISGDETFCKSICGTIQWIGKSMFRPNHKRKNWFVSISEIPEPDTMPELDSKNLIITAMKASGPGGQSVNTTDSAIRVVHTPTGLVATSREERSQNLNKKTAVAKLARMIHENNQSKLSDAEKLKWNYHNTLERGNAIRVYTDIEFKRKV